MSYKKNDWNVNRLFVAWMRIKHNEKVKYCSNQGAIQLYKQEYFKKFVKAMIIRKTIRLIKFFLKMWQIKNIRKTN